MEVQKLDNIAWGAAKSMAVASFAGYALGCPRSATQLTLVAALGAATINQFADANPKDPIRRAGQALFATSLTLLGGYSMGYRLTSTTSIAMAAGLGVGHVWTGPESNKTTLKLPILAYPVVGALIGLMRPQWWTPMQGAAMAGLGGAAGLLAANLRHQEGKPLIVREWLSLAVSILFVLRPQLAQQLGQSITFEQMAYSGLAMSVTELGAFYLLPTQQQK